MAEIEELEQKFLRAWSRFCDFYKEYGAHKYGLEGLWGPYIREERDIVFHLARFCLKELGLGFVHLDSPITGFWFENFKSKKHYIDIDITDPETFCTRNTPHGIFVEVKWIYKDITKVPRGKLFLRRRIEGIEKDCMKLQGHVKNNRCKIAYMCIIDDEHYISDEQLGSLERKYPAVKFLILKP